MCACVRMPGWPSRMWNSEDDFWMCSRLPPCWGGRSLCCCVVLQARWLSVSTFLPTAGVLRVQTWPLHAAFYVCSRNETWVLRFVWLEFPPRSHLPSLTVLLLCKACVLGAGTFNSHPLMSSSRPSASDLAQVGKDMSSSRPDCFSLEHSPLRFLSMFTKKMALLAPATLLSLISTSRRPPLSVSPSRYVSSIINNSSEVCACSELLEELPELGYIDLFFTSMRVLKGSCSLLFGTTKLCLESQIKISNSHLISKNRHFIILREEPI